MKKCSKCKKKKEVSEYHKGRVECKVCGKEYNKRYRELNKDKIRERDLKNKKLYYIKNKKRMREYATERNKLHPELRRKYRQENKEKINKYNAEYHNKKYREDDFYRMKHCLRGRISKIFRQRSFVKGSKSQQMIGCEFEFAKTWIENKFTKGMTWENFGEWEIDHKIPLSSAKTEQELRDLCHYTNLQPLWDRDNIRKTDKILPIQTSLLI